MNVLILGAAGFIGTNLVISLAKNKNCTITAVDNHKEYFTADIFQTSDNVRVLESLLEDDKEIDRILTNQEIVYHLVSTNIPFTSNQHVKEELMLNFDFTLRLLDGCVRNGVKKIVFISSGGTVYGKDVSCPIKEESSTHPITSYGVQKLTIEKFLYLYKYLYKLDYRVIRLSNPYGPYQRPNGQLGAVTTFTYKALKGEEIQVYGDGSVIRDFIYIEDAINAILNITENDTQYCLYNVGSGCGTSIKELLIIIESCLDLKLNISFKDARTVDVPVNYLDVTRYETEFGNIAPTGLEDGIHKLAMFMREYYHI